MDRSPETQNARDSMGAVDIPSGVLWGPQTQRAVVNFPVSGLCLERNHIEALALVKKAAAQANAVLGVLDADIADVIEWAAGEVASGTYDDQFPVDVYQTGSGTSSNMNANEVIASLASAKLGREVLPNDHVNASQSSNDVFPTSVHVAALSMTRRDLIPALGELADVFQAKAREFSGIVKAGRTHLMDATPVTLGQEFGGYEASARLGIDRLEAALDRVAEVPLGGTAVGTGINTPEGFASKALSLLNKETGLSLREARNHFEAQGSRDALVELHGALKTIAVSLTKACNDLRWMASGPKAGLGEITLPALQPGSSIMPGKINPVVPEAVLQVCSRVIGNDASVTWAAASGTFELNVQMPVMSHALLESIRLLTAAARLLASKAVRGIEANADHMRRLAKASTSIVTPLSPILGYEAAASIAHRSVDGNLTVREAVLDLGFVDRGEITEEQLDALLDVDSMTNEDGL